ncbi:MAG: hypothetical protein CMM84_18405 [Rhodothermaceae bacterium]|nr:hypothetical protein [Rhodothermaceae bacterium]
MPEPTALRRIDWGVLGVEAFAIFLSVLLGFGVTEWRDARAEAGRRADLLEAFAQEIAANRDGLVGKGSYHHWLVREVGAEAEAGRVRVLSDVFQIENVSGFNPLSLSGTAWQTATATGDIALLDFDTASLLWRLYDAQRQIDDEQDRMRAIALDQFNSTDPGQVTRFLTLMREFTSLERELLFLTTEALQSIADDRGLEPPLAIPADVFERDPFAATSSGSPSPVAPPDDRE